MEFHDAPDNYVTVQKDDGSQKIYPKSFIVQMGDNDLIRIGTQRQCYEMNKPEIVVPHNEVVAEGLKPDSNPYEVAAFLAQNLFMGEYVPIITDSEWKVFVEQTGIGVASKI